MAEVSKIAQGINKEEFEEMFNEHLKEDQVTLAVHIDHFALTQQSYTDRDWETSAISF